MAEGHRRQCDPDFGLLSASGREKFKRLFEAEVSSMADTGSKDSKYSWIRITALTFFDFWYAGLQSDAVIPYTAVIFVDRVYLLLGHDALVDKFSHDHYTLFFAYCLYRSWSLRSRSESGKEFLTCIGLHWITDTDVLNVRNIIPVEMDWSSPITPFFFVEFFAPFLTLQPPTSALRSVYQFILSSQFEIACTQFRPSVMAFSAMLVCTVREHPAKLDSFKSRVMKYDLFAPLVELQPMIDKCQCVLKPLYYMSSPPRSTSINSTHSRVSLPRLFPQFVQPVLKIFQRDSSKVMEIEMISWSGGDAHDTVALLKLPLEWDKVADNRARSDGLKWMSPCYAWCC